MIAGLATHADLMARDGPYVLGGREVRIVDESTFAVREPTPNERLVLDAYFLQDPARLPCAGHATRLSQGNVLLTFVVGSKSKSRSDDVGVTGRK